MPVEKMRDYDRKSINTGQAKPVGDFVTVAATIGVIAAGGLPRLTQEDLKEIGVGPVGHAYLRRRCRHQIWGRDWRVQMTPTRCSRPAAH